MHGLVYYEATKGDASHFAHFSSGPYASADDFISTFLRDRSYPDEKMYTFAVEDKAGRMAGMVSLVNADVLNRRADIGLLHVLPAFQGLGVGLHVGKLLLAYGMRQLGLVRMEWRCDTNNAASIGLARKLGLREVGTVQCERLLRDGVGRGKKGNGRVVPGTTEGDVWRDVVIFEHVATAS